MKPTHNNKPRSSRNRFSITLALGLLLVSLTPFAAAAQMGWLGDVRSNHWSAWAFGGAVVGVALVGLHLLKPNFVGKRAAAFGLVLLVGGPLALVMFNEGGFVATGGPQTASIAAGLSPAPGVAAAAAPTSSAYDSSLYWPTSDLTFSFADAYKHWTINPSIDIFTTCSAQASTCAPTEKMAVEGSATPYYSSLAATGGKVTQTGWSVSTLSCALSVHVDLANYYEALVPIPSPADGNINACAPRDGQSHTTAVSIPQLTMKGIGAFDITGAGTSLTCSAGTDCIYGLQIKNSNATGYLEHVAVEVGTLTNATINSIDSTTASFCSLGLNPNGKQEIVVTINGGEIGPLGYVQCNIHVSRASGSSGGSFVLTADDLYEQYDAPSYVTNTNIRNAAASSALTVSFA